MSKPKNLRNAASSENCWTCKLFGFALANGKKPDQPFCFKYFFKMEIPEQQVCDDFMQNLELPQRVTKANNSPTYRCINCEYQTDKTKMTVCPECGDTKIGVIYYQ